MKTTLYAMLFKQGLLLIDTDRKLNHDIITITSFSHLITIPIYFLQFHNRKDVSKTLKIQQNVYKRLQLLKRTTILSEILNGFVNHR